MWEINGKYTIIAISSMLAMTTKSEIQVKELDSNGEPIFVQRGKRIRRQFIDGISTNKLLFQGWDIPLKTDGDQTGSFTIHGNACFNFLGTPEFVKEFIDKNNVNEYFSQHDSILAHGEKVSTDSGIPVYPETATTHAVILKIREKLGLKEAPEVVYSYSRNQAIDDEILTGNPRREVFHECDIITTNLSEKLLECAYQRNLKRIDPIDAGYLLGCLLLSAKEIYENSKFDGDQDKDFFIVPANEEGIAVWFVRNENARLTAMLPEDY